MAAENKPRGSTNNGNNKRKQRYLPHNKAVKKGSYPLHPGVQGFFLTCDGGRERQATHEAINVIDTFYEELVDGVGVGKESRSTPSKPLNKKIKFSDSDSSSDNDVGEDGKSKHREEEDANNEHQTSEKDETSAKKPRIETGESKCEDVGCDKTEEKSIEVASKCEDVICDKTEEKSIEVASKCQNVVSDKTEEKSIDKLIEDEIKELGDRSKRRFVSLDSGCNGCIFVQMPKRDGGPGPAEIVQHIMTSAAATRKHMSRFILRVLPVEVTCYASEEEISKAIKPLIAQYFPAEAPTALKFAVLYEARANTGIDRMKIINAVAKSVPEPHKVDLNNSDKTIIVQICKTICMIGVVEKYKELSKYNLRQLTSPKA